MDDSATIIIRISCSVLAQRHPGPWLGSLLLSTSFKSWTHQEIGKITYSPLCFFLQPHALLLPSCATENQQGTSEESYQQAPNLPGLHETTTQTRGYVYSLLFTRAMLYAKSLPLALNEVLIPAQPWSPRADEPGAWIFHRWLFPAALA